MRKTTSFLLGRKMKTVLPTAIVLFCIFLSACNAAPPQTTATAIPTNTQQPTSVPTNTVMPTPTATLEPTSTPTPASINRTPSYPSEVFNDGRFEDVECPGETTFDMEVCAAHRAFQSARELDTLLLELDQHFPNGSWEEALSHIILPEEEWESYKIPYCMFDNQDSIGGTAHGLWISDCIEEQNLERIKWLKQIVCMFTEGFSRCTPGKPGGEEPILTAIPQNSKTITPSQEPISKEPGDYLIYSVRDKLTFYDPAADLYVPILPDWEIYDFIISSDNVLTFSSAHDGDVDIYLLNYPFIGNEPRNITDKMVSDDWAEAWSPDGQLLAFESEISSSERVLSIWDGNSVSQIHRYSYFLSGYSWNKDGRLVFSEHSDPFSSDKPSEIFLWDGDIVHNVSQNPSGEDQFPAWSDDGQLAFNSEREGEYDIFVWDGVSMANGLPDATTYKNITPKITGYYSRPVWTSSGTLSFSGTEGNFAQIYEWDGETATNISNVPSIHNLGQSWNKNGFWAFTAPYTPVIYVRNEENQTILKTEGQSLPVWSKDGYLMYCIQDRPTFWTLLIWDGENIITVDEADADIDASWANGNETHCSNG